MKKILPLALILFFDYSQAQSDRVIDSVRTIALKHQDDKSRTEANVYLSKIFLNRNENDSAKKYAEAALLLSKKINFAEGVAVSKEIQGRIELFTGHFKTAYDNFDAA